MEKQTLHIYTHKTPTARLRYVLDWVVKERLAIDYEVIISTSFSGEKAIGYGFEEAHPCCIPFSGLLVNGANNAIGLQTELWTQPLVENGFQFDFLSAIFYLLSRMEEWDSPLQDEHGRYPAEASILNKIGMLHIPIVDKWVFELRLFLVERLGLEIPEMKYSFQPTYDIDIAWSYKNKGLLRNTAGLARDLLKGQFSEVAARIKSLLVMQKDPYDSYAFLKNLHQENDLRPIYFMLAALQTGSFDKNIHPEHAAMKALVKRLQAEGQIGMHPSYDTDTDNGKLWNEHQVLEVIAGNAVTQSRQHFIKYRLPTTPKALIALGITDDYSMGYPEVFGFRAATGTSFLWYDLSNEAPTQLRLHPFCWMDSTAMWDMGLDANEAFMKLGEMNDYLKKYGSRLVTVLHNYSLGTEPQWNGWAAAYKSFVETLKDSKD